MLLELKEINVCNIIYYYTLHNEIFISIKIFFYKNIIFISKYEIRYENNH